MHGSAACKTDGHWPDHISGDNHCACRGFTLLEILITVVVLSIGLVLVLQSLHGVLYAWDGTMQRTRRVMAVQELFTQVRSVAFSGKPPVLDLDLFALQENVEGHAGLYRIQYRDDARGEAGGPAFALLLYVAPEEGTEP